jgi:signal transduction histidine kinase
VGTLAAGLAHEINNPLTIITGRAELLIAKLRRNPETIVSDQTIKEIQNIHDMGIRISTIMKQLLTYSRRSEYLTDVQLNMVLDDAEQLLQTKIERKGIEIIKEYDHPPHIRGVANQLQQVFVNILGNAVDASPEQSRITMGYKTWDDVVVAFVKDEGSGMSKELQEHIFEPFFTTKGIGEGTGLGLYICHKIIEEHEGEIEISSREGEGTTFSIKLPLAVAHKDKSVTAA